MDDDARRTGDCTERAQPAAADVRLGDGGRVAVGAPSVRRHWLRAYVLRLEHLEELVVACAFFQKAVLMMELPKHHATSLEG